MVVILRYIAEFRRSEANYVKLFDSPYRTILCEKM